MKFSKKLIELTKRAGIVKVSDRDIQLANSHINIGKKKYLGLDYKEALKSFTEAITLDPYNYIAYSLRGECKKDLKLYDKAIEDFNKAIELNPEYADAYLWRGVTKFLKVKNGPFNHLSSNTFSSAKNAIDDVILSTELEPNNFFYLSKRSMLYEFTGKLGLAVKDLDRLIENSPFDGELYYKRGNLKHRIYLTSKQACEDWNEAYDLGCEDAAKSLENYCDEN